MSRRHRLRRRARSSRIPLVLESFGDAVGLAWSLHDDLGRGEAAFRIDRQGRVVDGVALTARWHRPEHALAYLLVGDLGDDDRRVVLCSLRGDDDVTVLAEDDIAAFRRLERDGVEGGLELVDWLHAGGEAFRSMRVALEPGSTAWDG